MDYNSYKTILVQPNLRFATFESKGSYGYMPEYSVCQDPVRIRKVAINYFNSYVLFCFVSPFGYLNC